MKLQLNKTCIICGNARALAAFLEMTSSQGTVYGNVCSACRGANAQPNEKIILDEEDGSTSSGLRIDANVRNLAEMEEDKLRHTQEEETKEKRDKRDALFSEKTDKTDQKQKAELKHRQDLAAKNKQKPSPFQDNTIEEKQILQTALNAQEAKKLVDQYQDSLEKQNLESDTQKIRLEGDIQSNQTLVQDNKVKLDIQTIKNKLHSLSSQKNQFDLQQRKLQRLQKENREEMKRRNKLTAEKTTRQFGLDDKKRIETRKRTEFLGFRDKKIVQTKKNQDNKVLFDRQIKTQDIRKRTAIAKKNVEQQSQTLKNWLNTKSSTAKTFTTSSKEDPAQKQSKEIFNKKLTRHR